MVQLHAALRRLAAVTLGLGVGFALAELGARHLGPIAGEDLYYGGMAPPPEGLFRSSATLAVEPTPGFVGVRYALDVEMPLRINSVGLRGPELTEGGERWFTVGDSFVFGAQVREEETFQVHLGEALGVQVLNGGVDSYSTLQAARRYAELDEKVDASTVVAVYFLGNDLHDNHQAEALLRAAPGAGERKAPGIRYSPLTVLARNSYVAAYVHVALQRRTHLAKAEEGETHLRDDVALWSYEGKPRLDTLMEATRAALTELRDTAAARGDDVLVAVAPPAWFVDPAMLDQLLEDYDLPKTATSDYPRTAVMAALADLGIPKCDLSPGLRAAFDAGEGPYLRFDGHWSAVGHRVAAEEIARCVRRERHERRRGSEGSDALGAPGAETVDGDRPRPRRPAGEARVPGGGGRADRPGRPAP
jgi:hypothetical protein